MQVTLASLGGGGQETMTAECAAAMRSARCILGAKRLLEHLPRGCTDNRIAAVRAQELLDAILGQQGGCVVVFSGDAGFYSGARGLLPLLAQRGIPVQVLPGVSSVQLFAARLGRPWQDWELVSAHGVDCNVIGAVSRGKPAFFLTGGALGPGELCRMLADAGLGFLPVAVGENLSGPEEKITTSTAAELAGRSFASLSVLLAEPAPRFERRSPGLPDGMFVRGQAPMTKQEVRAAALAKLGVGPSDVLWDVGAGTGSVSVELALSAPEGQVFAVECDEDACALVRENKRKFSTWNLQLVEGKAPQALAGLPAPDAVFIGGTKGGMEDIVGQVLAKNENARICISAIALETLSAAVTALEKHGLEADVAQIAVSRTRPAGKLHLLMANNPTFLITGERHG